jgi:outer membrane protein TolC
MRVPPNRSAILASIAGSMSLWMFMSLVACTVDQKSEVEVYRGLLDLGPVEPIRHDAPLSLRGAVAHANDVNEELSIEGEAYVRALADRRRSTAALLPELDGFGDLAVRENVGGGASSDNIAFDAGLRARYTLLSGMTDVNLIRAATLTAEERLWLLLDLRETLLLDTASAYYTILLAERRVRVLESSLAVQEERLRDIRGRREAGFARPLDVAQIEAQASETRVSLLDARNDELVARAALGLLTGLDVRARALSDGFDPPVALPTQEELLEAAIANRQDVSAARARAASARRNVDAEIGRYYPSVTVNLDYFLYRESTPDDRAWAGILSANLPIFSAGRIDADVREAWSFFREAVLNHSHVRRRVVRDVEVAVADLVLTRERVTETTKQVASAEEALRQAEAAYGAGLGTNLERIAAQDQLLSAQLRAATEEYTAKLSYLVGARAAGMLTPTLTGNAGPTDRLPPRREVPESPFVVLPGARASDPADPISPNSTGSQDAGNASSGEEN